MVYSVNIGGVTRLDVSFNHYYSVKETLKRINEYMYTHIYIYIYIFVHICTYTFTNKVITVILKIWEVIEQIANTDCEYDTTKFGKGVL